MKKLILVAALGLLAACAHHKDVRPGADGVHRVSVVTEDTEEGSRDAIDQANHYCKEFKQHAVFMNESQKYTGDMDEQTYKNSKRAAKVAKTVGGGVWAMGGKKESDIGGIVGLGGQAADQALGKGYTVEMKFQCK